MVSSKSLGVYAIIGAILILSIFALQSQGFKAITGKATQSVTVNISVSNSAPQVIRVFNETLSAVSITESSATNLIVNFTASDSDGAANLEALGGNINISKTGEQTRYNSTCNQIQASGTQANYSCTVKIWYFDGAGTWNISVSVNDSSNSRSQNTTNTFGLQETTAFALNPSALTFSSLSPGSTNQTSNSDPLILNNTGNKEINSTGISINATNLVGETNTAFALYAANFTISNHTSSPSECNGTRLTRSDFKIITDSTKNVNANITRGNYSLNDGISGIESLYLCLNLAGSELTQQAYSTLNQGAWTIRAV